MAVTLLGAGSEIQTVVAAQGATSFWPLACPWANFGFGANALPYPDQIGSRSLEVIGDLGVIQTADDSPFADATAVVNDSSGRGWRTNATFNLDQDWSTSFWFKFGNLGAAVIVLALGNSHTSTNYLYFLHRDDQAGLVFQGAAGSATTTYAGQSGNYENDGEWHHCALTRDYSATAADDVWTSYIDGVQAAQFDRSVPGWGSFTASAMGLGDRTNGSSLPFAGGLAAWALAEGVVWTPTQVADQFAVAA